MIETSRLSSGLFFSFVSRAQSRALWDHLQLLNISRPSVSSPHTLSHVPLLATTNTYTVYITFIQPAVDGGGRQTKNTQQWVSLCMMSIYSTRESERQTAGTHSLCSDFSHLGLTCTQRETHHKHIHYIVSFILVFCLEGKKRNIILNQAFLTSLLKLFTLRVSQRTTSQKTSTHFQKMKDTLLTRVISLLLRVVCIHVVYFFVI